MHGLYTSIWLRMSFRFAIVVWASATREEEEGVASIVKREGGWKVLESVREEILIVCY